MKSKKLFHVCLAGIMSAAMFASTVPVQAAVFESGVEAAEAEVEPEMLFTTEEAEDASQISSKAASEIKINASTFPDANFRTYVSSMFDKDNSGGLSSAEISAAKEINVSGKNIARLNGVERFTSLTKLNASNNKLTTVDLSKNTKLTYVNVSNNKLTVLDLRKCTGGLVTVMCSNNAITKVGFPSASTLKKLEYVDVSHNKIASQSSTGLPTLSISKLPDLTEFNGSYNSITSFNCSGFEGILDLSNNKITTLSGGSEGYQAAAIYLEGSGNTLSKTSKIDFAGLGNRVPQRFSCNSAVKSKVAMVTPRLSASMKGTYDQVSISMGSSSDYATYKLEKKVGSGSYKTIASWGEGEFDDPEFAENNYTDYDISAGNIYTYRLTVSVKVQDRNKNSVEWPVQKTVTVKAVPSAPSISVKNSSTRTVTITWKKVSGADGYNVYMQKKGGKAEWIGKNLTGTSMKKTGLTKGATYYFKANCYVEVNGKKYNSAYSAVKGGTIR